MSLYSIYIVDSNVSIYCMYRISIYSVCIELVYIVWYLYI